MVDTFTERHHRMRDKKHVRYVAEKKRSGKISSVSIQFDLLCFIITIIIDVDAMLNIHISGRVLHLRQPSHRCDRKRDRESCCRHLHFDWPNQQSIEIYIFYHNSCVRWAHIHTRANTRNHQHRVHSRVFFHCLFTSLDCRVVALRKSFDWKIQLPH